MQRIHIFRAGAHTPMAGAALVFSAADLAATARAYDPAKYEAPLVVGHPTLDAPAYGWVGDVTAEAGNLFATPRQVEPAFASLVRDGRFKKVSVSFFRPDHPRNPTPGVYAVKHVGFLGAAAPAVQGLRPIEFSAEDAGVITLEFAASPTPRKDTSVTDEDIAARTRAAEQREADLAAAQIAFAARESAFAGRETALAGRERAARTADDAAFVQSLVGQAQLPAGLTPRVVAFMAALADTGEVSFAEGDATRTETPRAAFRALLAGLPKAVALGEITPSGGPGAGDPVGSAEFAGLRVDPDRMALHRRALAYQRAHPETEYLAAVLAVEQTG